MTKYDFITETNQLTGEIRYWTEKDGLHVDYTISNNKDTAYDKFLAVASGVNFRPNIEITDTIYSTNE